MKRITKAKWAGLTGRYRVEDVASLGQVDPTAPAGMRLVGYEWVYKSGATALFQLGQIVAHMDTPPYDLRPVFVQGPDVEQVFEWVTEEDNSWTLHRRGCSHLSFYEARGLRHAPIPAASVEDAVHEIRVTMGEDTMPIEDRSMLSLSRCITGTRRKIAPDREPS